MRRRRFLAAAAVGISGVSGCAERVNRPLSSPTPTAKGHPLPTARGHPNTIFVGEDGSDDNDGTQDSPLGTVQEAINRAHPGQSVHAQRGQYFESLSTVRAGRPGAPITITGPPDAIIAGNERHRGGTGLKIRHSHVHLTGLTFDGLHDSARPDDVESYVLGAAVESVPAGDEYLTDLVIKPHRVGNVLGNHIHLFFSENVEVGEFRVIGPSGLNYLLTDKEGHYGEIVYIGVSVDGPLDEFGLTPLDGTNNVHIHHIDNSEGHPHSEIVNPKFGTYDILIEYCTDGGGSQNTHPNNPSSSINLGSPGTTVRWCDLRNGHGEGIALAPVPPDGSVPEDANLPPTSGGEIYGNRISGFDDGSLTIYDEIDVGSSPDNEWMICGNEFDGDAGFGDGTHIPLDAACDGSIPTREVIGHSGGDSPW